MAYSLIRGPIVNWYPYPFINPTHPGGYWRVLGYSVVLAAVMAVLSVAFAFLARASLADPPGEHWIFPCDVRRRAMSVSLFAVIVDSNDPEQLAQFWATTLGWDSTRRNEGEFQVSNPAAGEISLYFMDVPEPKQVKNRLHLDLLADGPMEPEVERLIERGAQLVEVREDPELVGQPRPDGRSSSIRKATSSA